jgi:hypothetical protein
VTGSEALRRSEPQPEIGQIFVLGTARSGTTWLANILGSHPMIAAVMAVEHHGIHESHLLDHTRYVLKGTMTCDEFFSQYESEDYCQICNVERTKICARIPVGTAVTFFTELMDAFARARDANCWLEKTPKHTIYAEELRRLYPRARFVIITRSRQDVLTSQMRLYPRPGATRGVQVFEKSFRYASDMKAIRRLCRRASESVSITTYDALCSDTSREVERIQRELGVPVMALTSGYAPSSSFSSAADRASGQLSSVERIVALAGTWITGLLPFALVLRLRIRRDRAQAVGLPKYARVATRGRTTVGSDDG